MRGLTLSLAVFSGLWLAACTSTSVVRPHSGPEAPPTARMEAVRSWELMHEGEVVGHLVRFQMPEVPGRAFYSVRDVHDLDRGVVDLDGRAYRYTPHEAQPVWVGTGTVLDGALAILAAPPESVLREVPVPASGAPSDPPPTVR